MKRLLPLLALMFSAAPCFAGDAAPATAAPASKGPSVVGQFGFDWLKPGAARCDAVTEKAQAGFKSCEYFGKGATGSFSGDADYHKCVAGAKSEIMVYKTKERCAQELEIMQSNGP